MKVISPKELSNKLSTKETSVEYILDVRTPIERREIHIEGSIFHPLDDLKLDELTVSSGESPLYILCRSGARAHKAQKTLSEQGLANTIVIEGGILAWANEGLPVIKEKSVISLMRQVQIVAGFFVFLGVCLSYFVHPYWVGLSAFVGLALMFAGITNTCALGMLIAKMPWNQSPKSCCSK